MSSSPHCPIVFVVFWFRFHFCNHAQSTDCLIERRQTVTGKVKIESQVAKFVDAMRSNLNNDSYFVFKLLIFPCVD